MRVGFVGSMPARGYSGGRLAALTYAESLAAAGADVSFFTDHRPQMLKEFKHFSRVHYEAPFEGGVESANWKGFDWIIIVPSMNNPAMLEGWAQKASRAGSRIALLNFESGDWFNSLSNVPRSIEKWDGWKLVASKSSAVISLSQEGNKWAKGFYTSVREDCTFTFCYPSINSIVADQALRSSRKRTNTILVLSRVDHHKGLDQIHLLANQKLRGLRVSIHLGNGTIDREERKDLKRRFRAVGMNVSIAGTVVGLKKFRKLQSARALFFPTRFEGFGIPPLEAAYCGTPVVASDLPVLKEFGGESFHYFENDSQSSALNALEQACHSDAPDLMNDRLRAMAQFDRAGRDLLAILHG